MTKLSDITKILLSCLFAISLSTAVHAADDPEPEPKPKPKKEKCAKNMYWNKKAKRCQCKKGWVWSKKQKQCLKKTAEILSDQDLYKAAVSYIRAEDYKTGLDLLWRIKDQNQPKVLNYLGYANRKLGKIDEGIVYYKKALAIDANFNQARQYLGEGYVQKGDMDKAKEQLAQIGKRCGENCDYYKSLASLIASKTNKNT